MDSRLIGGVGGSEEPPWGKEIEVDNTSFLLSFSFLTCDGGGGGRSLVGGLGGFDGGGGGGCDGLLFVGGGGGAPRVVG